MGVPPPPGFTIRAERQPSGEPTMAGPAQAQKNDTPKPQVAPTCDEGSIWYFSGTPRMAWLASFPKLITLENGDDLKN
ncbi:hypothetical protein V6N12_039435 [Hibiscus sabdariffa]|uniref:Uncharacterized protein n=1 Tax=Hibiscus sabdariffa TaxID=183260 RepID=A0ABR2E0P3_9ROSI